MRRFLGVFVCLSMLLALPALAAATGRLSGKVSVDEGDVGTVVVRLVPDEEKDLPIELPLKKNGRFTLSRCPKGTYRVEADGYGIGFISYVGRSPVGERVAEFSEEVQPGAAPPRFQIVPGIRATLEIQLIKIDESLTGGMSLAEAQDNSPKLARLNELFQAADWATLISEAEVLLAEDPELGGGQYLYAVALWQQKDYPAADAAMGRASELVPDQPGIFENHGALLVEHAQAVKEEDAEAAKPIFQRALQLLDRGLEDDPGSINALTNRVIALDGLGDNAKTLAALDALIAADASQVRAYLHKAQLLNDAGQPEAALAVFDGLPSDQPAVADEIYNVAVEFYNQEKSESAIAAVDKAMQINPELAVLYQLKGRLLIQMGQDAEGVALLRQYLARVPEDAPEAAADRALVEALSGG